MFPCLVVWNSLHLLLWVFISSYKYSFTAFGVGKESMKGLVTQLNKNQVLIVIKWGAFGGLFSAPSGLDSEESNPKRVEKISHPRAWLHWQRPIKGVVGGHLTVLLAEGCGVVSLDPHVIKALSSVRDKNVFRLLVKILPVMKRDKQ